MVALGGLATHFVHLGDDLSRGLNGSRNQTVGGPPEHNTDPWAGQRGEMHIAAAHANFSGGFTPPGWQLGIFPEC